MKKIFISPHLDDAICSCAGLINNYIKENHDVYVVTVFSNQVTPSELSEFAKELHSEWAENGSFDRVKENDEACRELKVKSINLNFDDAIYRKHLDKFLYPINDGSIFDKPSKYDAFLPDIVKMSVQMPSNLGCYRLQSVSRLSLNCCCNSTFLMWYWIRLLYRLLDVV